MHSYKTVEREAKDEFIEQRSRFIGYVKPVTTEEEALAFINEKRQKHWDATHNVYAYSLREGQLRRYSDDSQPLMWVMDGTTDIGSVGLADVETILNNATADQELVEWSSTGWTSQSMQLNLAVKDELKRPLFQDVNFRHALSIIVDRNQIAQLIDNGYTEPAQSAPSEGAQGYDPEWTAKWTEQDIEGAQAL